MENIGIWEVALLLLVALIIFGPQKLPEMGRSLGRGMREFKDSLRGHTTAPNGTTNNETITAPPGAADTKTATAPSPPAQEALPPSEPLAAADSTAATSAAADSIAATIADSSIQR